MIVVYKELTPPWLGNFFKSRPWKSWNQAGNCKIWIKFWNYWKYWHWGSLKEQNNITWPSKYWKKYWIIEKSPKYWNYWKYCPVSSMLFRQIVKNWVLRRVHFSSLSGTTNRSLGNILIHFHLFTSSAMFSGVTSRLIYLTRRGLKPWLSMYCMRP